MCCRNASAAVLQHQLHINQEPMQTVPLGNSNFNFLHNISINQFPFELNEYIEDFIRKSPKITGIQMEQIALLKQHYRTPGFNSFINNAYSTVLDIFNKCKISKKKRKCNWCKLCAHLHNVFASQLYREEIMEAFQLKKVTANANAICTRIYFDLLNMISAKEATEAKSSKLEHFIAEHDSDQNLDALDKSSLRYIAGACIHSVRNTFRRTAMQNVFKDHLKAKITNKTHQLTSRLIGSKTALEGESVEPESLLKLMAKDTGGLLFVTDETFTFFQAIVGESKILPEHDACAARSTISLLKSNSKYNG